MEFATETRFYRKHLRISYEFGSFLRKCGALSVDALMDDNRPLFLCDPENLERHRQEVHSHRRRVFNARQNIKKELVPA